MWLLKKTKTKNEGIKKFNSTLDKADGDYYLNPIKSATWNKIIDKINETPDLSSFETKTDHNLDIENVKNLIPNVSEFETKTDHNLDIENVKNLIPSKNRLYSLKITYDSFNVSVSNIEQNDLLIFDYRLNNMYGCQTVLIGSDFSVFKTKFYGDDIVEDQRMPLLFVELDLDSSGKLTLKFDTLGEEDVVYLNLIIEKEHYVGGTI